eukprot:COSAG05_NODE_3424_length_2076_cov_1.163379_5_plen_85_part_00
MELSVPRSPTQSKALTSPHMSTPQPPSSHGTNSGAGSSVVKIFDLNAEAMENDGLTAAQVFSNDVARPVLTYGYAPRASLALKH